MLLGDGDVDINHANQHNIQAPVISGEPIRSTQVLQSTEYHLHRLHVIFEKGLGQIYRTLSASVEEQVPSIDTRNTLDTREPLADPVTIISDKVNVDHWQFTMVNSKLGRLKSSAVTSKSSCDGTPSSSSKSDDSKRLAALTIASGTSEISPNNRQLADSPTGKRSTQTTLTRETGLNHLPLRTQRAVGMAAMDHPPLSPRKTRRSGWRSESAPPASLAARTLKSPDSDQPPGPPRDTSYHGPLSAIGSGGGTK